MLNSRGVLLSKIGRQVVTPRDTRLINVLPFPLRVVDKIITKLVENELWKHIGIY